MTERKGGEITKYLNLVCGMVENDCAPRQEIIDALKAGTTAIAKQADEIERLREEVEYEAKGADSACEVIMEFQFENKRLRDALTLIQWISYDKDNMEFTATITRWQMDKIQAALKESGDAEDV